VLQRRALFSLLLAAVVAAPTLGQDATLEWKLKEKTPFYQTMTTTTTQNMTVTGTKVEQKQEQTFYFSYTPTKVANNVITLEQKIIGLKMNIDIGGSKVSYDSTAKGDNAAANNPLNKFFDALKGATFTITLDLSGKDGPKVTNLEGHKDFVDKLTTANPQMKTLLEKILSKEALRDMAEPLFAALPGKKVTKGKEDATWKRTSKLDMGPIGSYETTYTYTYDGPDKDKKEEKIGIKTDLKYTPPTDKGDQTLPFKIKDAKLEPKDASGTIVYDPKAGWVKSLEMKMTLTGNLTIEIGQQSTTVDLTQDQTTKITTSAESPIKAQ